MNNINGAPRQTPEVPGQIYADAFSREDVVVVEANKNPKPVSQESLDLIEQARSRLKYPTGAYSEEEVSILSLRNNRLKDRKS